MDVLDALKARALLGRVTVLRHGETTIQFEPERVEPKARRRDDDDEITYGAA